MPHRHFLTSETTPLYLSRSTFQAYESMNRTPYTGVALMTVYYSKAEK